MERMFYEILRRVVMSVISFVMMSALGYFLMDLSRDSMLTDEERQREIEKANKLIEQNCK